MGFHYILNPPRMSLLLNAKFTYGQFRSFLGVKFVLKFHILNLITYEEMVRFFSDVKSWYQIFTDVKNRYQILTHVKICTKSSHL